MPDNINPDHYKTSSGIESIDVMEAFNLTFSEGCAVKYLLRYKKKNGLEDLLKCKWYVERLIKNHSESKNKKK